MLLVRGTLATTNTAEHSDTLVDVLDWMLMEFSD